MVIDTKRLTYEAFLKLPETKRRYEIIDGELLFMSPSPTPHHQRISRNLFRLFDRFVTDHSLGEVLYAPLDILIRRDPLRIRQPDLLFVSQQRQGIIGSQHIEGGPDVVVEILLPANTRLEVQNKLQDYWAIQVQKCWLVSPEARTVEVLRHAGQGFERVNLFGMGDVLTSSILPEFRLEVENIW